jgi:Family of unknown function (DUF6152)
MNSNALRQLGLALAAALFSLPGAAHHGTSASYEGNVWVTVEGTVAEFRWRNPHSSLFLDIVNEKGEHVNFGIELPSPILMSRTLGWTRDTFKPGDAVQFRVHPSRTGAPVGVCLSECNVHVNGKLLPNQIAPSEQ